MDKITRNQFLKDIFCTAIESGIDYWSTVEVYRPQHAEASIRVTGGEQNADGTYPWHLIATSTIASGLRNILSKTSTIELMDGIRDDIQKASKNNDAGNIDGWYADIILQAGLFGEVKFG